MTNKELFAKLMQLQWLLHRQMVHGYKSGSFRMDDSRGQGRILGALHLRDGMSTKDLSALLEITVSTLNEQLAKLEKAEYITREPSEKDKRVMLIKLTEKGRELPPPKGPEPGEIFDCLSEEEREAFAGYLDRISLALEEKLGSESGEFCEQMKTFREAQRRLGEEGFCPTGGHGFHGRGFHGR